MRQNLSENSVENNTLVGYLSFYYNPKRSSHELIRECMTYE